VVSKVTDGLPAAGAQATETMPENACQHRYLCASCGEMLSPGPGDCCVFCSYADTACPPKQVEAHPGAGRRDR